MAKSARKNTVEEARRWLRVGALSLAFFGPVLNSLVARLRERTAALQERAAYQKERLAELRELPYSDELRSRGAAFTGALNQRGRQVSQVVVERGKDLGRGLSERGARAGQILIERGSDLGQDVSERGSRATRVMRLRGEETRIALLRRGEDANIALRRRGEDLSRSLRRRGREFSDELAERRNLLLVIAGFVVGLVAAGVAVYIFVRRRIPQRAEEFDDHIQLPSDYHPGTTQWQNTGEPRPIIRQDIADLGSMAMDNGRERRDQASVAVAEQRDGRDLAILEGATLFGVERTGLYYSIEDPVDQVANSDDRIFYFRSVEDAQAAGFRKS